MRSLHKRKSDTRKIIEDVEYFVKFKRSLNFFVSKMYSFLLLRFVRMSRWDFRHQEQPRRSNYNCLTVKPRGQV